MRRTVLISQQVGGIFLWVPGALDTITWTAGPENPLRFPFREPGVDGSISLSLDVPPLAERKLEGQQAGATPPQYPMACGTVQVLVDGQCAEGVSQRCFLQTAQRLADVYLNRLLSYVRTELSQHWVVPVPIGDWKLGFFLFQGKAALLEDGEAVDMVDGDPARHMIAPPLDFYGAFNPLYKSRREDMCRFIQDGSGPPAERELIASAKQHFVNSEYGVAAVEAVSALEVGLGTFVGRRLRRKRSYKRYRDVRERIGPMTYLKVVLPLAATEQEFDSCRTLIAECAKLVAVRNRVVHAAVRPGDDDVGKIRAGITAVELMLIVLGGSDGGRGV